jgi:hypothetical protein
MARGRPFQPGTSGNPKGRPPGIVEPRPRGTLRRVIDRFIAERNGEELMLEAFHTGIQDRRRALGFLELAGRVNREIGLGSDHGTAVVTIVFQSPLRKEKLR